MPQVFVTGLYCLKWVTAKGLQVVKTAVCYFGPSVLEAAPPVLLFASEGQCLPAQAPPWGTVVQEDGNEGL